MSTNQDPKVEQLKEEVATEYLKHYKSELGRLKSLALRPLEKEVKELLTGKKTLPEKFDEVKEFWRWGKLLSFVSADTAQEIFTFMKEKRLIIEQKKTENELLSLKTAIISGTAISQAESASPSSEQTVVPSSEQTVVPSSQSSNPAQETEQWAIPSTEVSTSSITTENTQTSPEIPTTNRHAKEKIIVAESVVGAGALNGYMEKQTNKKLAQQVGKERLNFGVEELKKMNDKAIELLKQQKKNPRLAKLQLDNINKSIKRFEKTFAKVGSSDLDVFKAYQEVSFRIPSKTLEGIAVLDTKILWILEKNADALVGLDEAGVKLFFKSNGIDNVSDEVVKMCKGFKNADEVLVLGKVLKSPSKLKGVVKMFRACFLIDLACLGFDIWAWDNGHDEAEMVAKVNEIRAQNKRDQANMQLYIWVASVVLEVWAMIAVFAAGGSVFWPIGTVVWLAVWALTVAASMGVDAMYYDVRDFYLQDKEDYVRKTRAEVKQAILQHLHNKKEGNVSLNEKLGATGEDLKTKKIENLKQAYESLFFLEELDAHQGEYLNLREYKQSGKKEADYLAGLTDEQKQHFTEQKEKLNKKIALRMEYIENSLNEEKIVAGLKSSQGQKYLSDLLGQSAFYTERKEQGLRKEGEDNLALAKKELLEKIPETIKIRLDTIAQRDMHLLYELYQGAKYLSLETSTEKAEDSNEEGEKDFSQTQNNASYICTYVQALELWKSREEKYLTTYDYLDHNFKYTEAVLEHDFALTGFLCENFDAATVKDISYSHWERNVDTSVSEKVSQNIIYRLAKEFYGYTGKNDAMELMQYYSETDGAVHGLYYKDGRYINNDWAVDQKFDLTYLDDKNLSERELSLQVNKIIKDILYTNAGTVDYTICVPALYAVNSFVIKPRKSMIDTPTEAIDTYLNDEFESSFKQILQEELGYRTTEKKEEIKNQISEFIKTFSKDGWYVELPYYLVISAKKAGLGDLEKTQFSFQNGKIVAAGQIHDLRAIGDLAVEKEFVEQARDKFTPEEMQYINLVESARKKIEDLRNIEGVGSREDELDFPLEIENDISQHSKDWNTLKGRLLCYDPNKAQKLLLVDNQDDPKKEKGYEYYYNYYNSLYLGILLSLNQFKSSNDIDTMSYFQQALYNGQKDLFDEKGMIKKDEKGKSIIKWSKGAEEVYTKLLTTEQFQGKTLQTLRASEDAKEKEIAKRYSRQIILTMFENGAIHQDGSLGFGSLNDRYDEKTKLRKPYATTADILGQVHERIAKQVVQNPFILPDLPLPEQYKTSEQLQIRSYAQRDKKSEQFSKAIQKTIEKTLPNVEWQGKRGNIKYNPENSTLESRWKKSKVEFEGEDKIKISGFSRSLDVQSGLWLLNFINWFHSTYTEHKEITYEYEWSRAWYRKGLVRDGTVLITGKDLKRYLTNLTDTEIDQIAVVLSSK